MKAQHIYLDNKNWNWETRVTEIELIFVQQTRHVIKELEKKPNLNLPEKTFLPFK